MSLNASLSVFKYMKRYRNRKHIQEQLSALEHATAHLLASTGRYKDQFDSMPGNLQRRFKNLIEVVYQTNAVYTGWLIESRPDFAPDSLKEFMK